MTLADVQSQSSGKDALMCYSCQHLFRDGLLLKVHLADCDKSEHDEKVDLNEQGLVCRFCCDSFLDLQHVQEHEEAHRSGGLIHMFSDTHAAFDTSSDAAPVNTNAPAPQYICDSCRLPFSNAYNLQRHKPTCRIHPIAPTVTFICPECNHNCGNRADNLQSHIRAHHNPLVKLSPLRIPSHVTFGEQDTASIYWVRTGLMGEPHRVHVVVFNDKGQVRK
jgi:hypothetical protein